MAAARHVGAAAAQASRALIRDERGAVTIDWVALTAAVLLLGIAVVYSIFEQGVVPLSLTITDALTEIPTCVQVEVSQTSLEDRVTTLEDCHE